jgi:GNAT superfamily N-acetyltransferase
MNSYSQIMLGDEEYIFVKQYQEDELLRNGLNRLTSQTFGFDFEEWFGQGFWTDRYRPYSLLHNNQLVANVSINPIDFIAEGSYYHTLQIGTVMTAKEYRNKGLSRALLNIIMEEYDDKVDLMYLYANASVLDFYPRFGFTKAQELLYTKNYSRSSRYRFRKLDGTDAQDRQLLLRLVSSSKPVSKYAMVDNPNLPMFYLMAPLAGCCYYCEELDLVAVVEYEEENILVQDLFCKSEFDMEEVVASLLDRDQGRVFFGFTPSDTSVFRSELLQEPDTFFVKGNNFIKEGRLPVLSHA